MKGKLLLLTGAAVGYVLGTRAGRDRYDRIKERAGEIWHDPTVQQKVSDAQGAVKEKAPELQHKLTDAASSVAGKAKSAVQRDHDDDDRDDVAGERVDSAEVDGDVHDRRSPYAR